MSDLLNSILKLSVLSPPSRSVAVGGRGGGRGGRVGGGKWCGLELPCLKLSRPSSQDKTSPRCETCAGKKRQDGETFAVGFMNSVSNFSMLIPEMKTWLVQFTISFENLRSKTPRNLV